MGMYVAQVHRGRGAGRTLLEAAIGHARARRALKMLTLTATQDNGPAINLYESLGFRQFGLEPMAVFSGGAYKAKVHMALVLDGTESPPT
jgi:ribosomal protein S18 acetylase RimI-like enzyme